MVVLECDDGDFLRDEIRALSRLSRHELVALERGLVPHVLEPARPVESIEHRRAPVVRTVWGADRQYRRLLLRKADAAVMCIPDVADADSFLWTRIEVPVLPVEERALRDGRRARERECPADHGACGDQRQSTRSLGHACEQCKGDREDGNAAAELVA